jgi:uncharacterized protein (TIGR02145 family)
MKKVSLIFSAIAITAMTLSGCVGSSSEVTIGNQVWMTENLNVANFRNGDPIPHARTEKDWLNAAVEKEPAWCYYNNDPANSERYGKLYNWYAVIDTRGLAPDGWKIPTDEDWFKLTDFLSGEAVAGKRMRFTDFWEDCDGESSNGTNESGFSGLPGGFRLDNGDSFGLIGTSAFWWSSTEASDYISMCLYLDCMDNLSLKEMMQGSGFSVRCLRY